MGHRPALMYVRRVDVKDRLRHALAARAHAKFFDDGFGWLGTDDTAAAQAEAKASDRDLTIVLREFCEEYSLENKHHGSYVVTPLLALRYETELDRGVFHQRNQLRRVMLAALLKADEGGYGGFDFSAAEEGWTHYSQGELSASGKTLELLGLAALRSETAGYIGMKITAEGVSVGSDQAVLARTLPVRASDDADAGAQVVSDAMRPLILDCEQLLREREWTEALSELQSGDAAYADDRWADAVREYYRAVESGLKYRLDEAGVSHSNSMTLRKLAGLAVQHGLIPSNYQELFSFLNSIRSPKAHGGGPKPEDVEIGRHEALLMGNHARALLLYLGGRAD